MIKEKIKKDIKNYEEWIKLYKYIEKALEYNKQVNKGKGYKYEYIVINKLKDEKMNKRLIKIMQQEFQYDYNEINENEYEFYKCDILHFMNKWL